MKTYCINYNLGNPHRDYRALIERIKSLGHGWCHCGGSHWFVNADMSTVQIRDHLTSVLDSNDSLIVHEVGNNWASWQMSVEVTNWLKANWCSSCMAS